MRYLKFYEAFKSKGISSTTKFLNDKVGKTSSEQFLNSLREFMVNIDFPIDKISDDDIKYLSAKKAFKLKSDKQVTNQKGIWVLKYWFSIEKGYLGFSATGNEKQDYSTNNSTHDGLREQRRFTESDLEYIKNNITRTGEIWPVSDYKKLETGDIVLGCFDGSYYQERLTLAKIFIDWIDNRRTYAIQGKGAGSEANDSRWRSYTDYGNLSWWLYDNGELGSDHSRLHFWRPSDTELRYIEPPVEEEKGEAQEEKEEDPFTWNLPLSNRFSFSSWGRGSSISMDRIKEADFALVLYFDDLINPEADATNYEKPSDTKRQRKAEKEGATRLLSDEEIKKMNIERYIQKLSASLNITETEFSDLQKIVTKHLAQEFSYFSILFQSPNWSNITEFTDYFYQIIDGNENEKSYYLSKTKNLYTSKVRDYYKRLLKYQESKKFIKGDSDLKKIFDELYKCGQNIFEHFSKMKIETIDDLWLVRQKINNLYAYMRMARNQFSYNVREVINGFRYPDEMEYYYNTYKDSYNKYQEDLEIIKRVNTFVKSL